MIRPVFLPIVTAPSLAIKLLQWCPGKINGFIVETSTAGGHNAPPRGQLILNERGEPVYGERDKIKTEEFAKLGVPFWIAGSFASPSGLAYALQVGAFGIQVGTAFAFCDESGIIRSIKNKVQLLVYRRGMKVFTDPNASPTGFPIKILNLEGTLSEEELYNSRIRNCSLGYLREPVWDGEKIIFRCAAEPIEAFVQKGGDKSATVGCKCICAGLCATVGARDGELPIITAGDDLNCIFHCMQKGRAGWHEDSTYSAKDVISFINNSW
jgi:NAD(P)H-dependent flavin oxidoreductase YrpB (nitropropane dioxygenase family)